MPAMHYRLKWPDHSESTCYSPSLVIQDYFTPGQAYALHEFLDQVREATHIASERVRAKFGFACSRAADQLAEIEDRATPFSQQPDAQIVVLSFETLS